MMALVAGAAAALAGFAAVELAMVARGAGAWPGRSWLARVGKPALIRRAGLPVPDDLAARIASARLGPGAEVRLIMGFKALLAAGSAAAAFALASLAPGGRAVFLLLALPVAGFLAPDAWLAWRARRIRALVLDEVPDVADRLHLAVTAGLAPGRAIAVSCGTARGPLSAELAVAAGCAQAGVPLVAALDRLVMRSPLPEVRSLAAALVRSQEQGTDIAPFLEELARDARRRQALRLQDRAQKAGPKIQLAVALMLVPAAMALIAAALVSGLFIG